MAAGPETSSTYPLTSIRPAQAGDAVALAAFAARTFRETFAADNTAEDMALYLAANYGPERQSAEIHDPGIVTLLAEDGRRLAGYSQLYGGRRRIVCPAPLPSRSGGFTWIATGRGAASRRRS